MTDLFRSERLLFKALEDEDDAILLSLGSDSQSFVNSSPFLPVPNGKESARSFRDWINKCLLGAIICLPAPVAEASSDVAASSAVAGSPASKPIPIGTITLTAESEAMRHHRHTMIGITISRQHQRRGYGTEAILWALEWAFVHAGMHKVEIGAFGYNTGAIKLYERLGFVDEGRSRDHLWHNGQFWDMHNFSMLENEWKTRYQSKHGSE